jgi:hypothetical protein
VADKDPVKGVGRNRSDVLDAIFDAVEATPAGPEARAGGMFRAKALEQIDVPKQLDNLLPLTARRRWIVLVGVAILIVAGVAYALGTTVVSSVPGTGRAVASPGVAIAASPQESVILSVAVATGDHVSAGQPMSEAASSAGSKVYAVSPVDGTVWQVLGAAGSVVARGAPVITVLPDGPQTSALFAVHEGDARQLLMGQQVTIVTGTGERVAGSVSAIETAPVPPAVASSRVAVTLASDAGFVLVSVDAASPLTPGDGLSATFTISEETLAQKLMSGL